MRCLVVGGGEVASRKMELLADLSCSLVVIAPELHDTARSIVARGGAGWIARRFQAGDCKGFQLVIAATPDREVNRAVFEEARAAGIPVNVVDDPELCTVIFPALWRDGPLALAVSTGGAAPFMAAAVRDRLSSCAKGMGRWVEAANRFRDAVRRAIADPHERYRMYRRFTDAPSRECADSAPASADLKEWLAWLDQIE